MAKGGGSPRGRTNDPQGLKRRLVETAYAVFATQGYHATAMHDVKRLAGVSGGALAHHFPTKRELAVAVIKERVAEAVEAAWIEPVQSAATVAEGIRAAFDRIALELERRGAVSGCPLNNLALELAREDEELRAQLDAIFVRWRQAIAAKVRADQQAGALLDLDPDGFATLVVAAYSGAMAMAKASQSAAPLKLCAQELARAL